jgi:hypothetical protein
MNATEVQAHSKLGAKNYWWLWVLDTVLVTGAFLFFLATHYGTFEFFGRALLMALLPLIPVMVLVGGAGSTIFVLTKVLIEKRGWSKSTALALLLVQALVIALPLVALGLWKSPTHRLSYICVGHAPATATDIRLTGYSTFLREEWLAVFRAGEKSFQTFVADAKLAPADGFFIQKIWEQSPLKATQLGKNLSPPAGASCFQRVFQEGAEHERGTVLAWYDPATGTAVVLRGYHD